jgi:hypothetical protein
MPATQVAGIPFFVKARRSCTGLEGYSLAMLLASTGQDFWAKWQGPEKLAF